jgi:hypothetical protein
VDSVDPDPDSYPEHCLFVTELVDSGPSTEMDIEREPTLTVAPLLEPICLRAFGSCTLYRVAPHRG